MFRHGTFASNIVTTLVGTHHADARAFGSTKVVEISDEECAVTAQWALVHLDRAAVLSIVECGQAIVSGVGAAQRLVFP